MSTHKIMFKIMCKGLKVSVNVVLLDQKFCSLSHQNINNVFLRHLPPPPKKKNNRPTNYTKNKLSSKMDILILL